MICPRERILEMVCSSFKCRVLSDGGKQHNTISATGRRNTQLWDCHCISSANIWSIPYAFGGIGYSTDTNQLYATIVVFFTHIYQYNCMFPPNKREGVYKHIWCLKCTFVCQFSLLEIFERPSQNRLDVRRHTHRKSCSPFSSAIG